MYSFGRLLLWGDFKDTQLHNLLSLFLQLKNQFGILTHTIFRCPFNVFVTNNADWRVLMYRWVLRLLVMTVLEILLMNIMMLNENDDADENLSGRTRRKLLIRRVGNTIILDHYTAMTGFMLLGLSLALSVLEFLSENFSLLTKLSSPPFFLTIWESLLSSLVVSFRVMTKLWLGLRCSGLYSALDFLLLLLEDSIVSVFFFSPATSFNIASCLAFHLSLRDCWSSSLSPPTSNIYTIIKINKKYLHY